MKAAGLEWGSHSRRIPLMPFAAGEVGVSRCLELEEITMMAKRIITRARKAKADAMRSPPTVTRCFHT